MNKAIKTFRESRSIWNDAELLKVEVVAHIARRRLVVCYLRFGKTYRFHLQRVK
jgi:hypothetical protein